MTPDPKLTRGMLDPALIMEKTFDVAELGRVSDFDRDPSNHLVYVGCSDWLILAEDQNGDTWYVSTECWAAWADLPDGADQEDGAIEKYMLPLARKVWTNLPWNRYQTT